jgi:hypothetical protein
MRGCLAVTFNDNFVRNMLGMLILFRFGGERQPHDPVATIVFILPSIPLSALGGEIADSRDKALIARRLKFAEIFVQMIAARGFAFASPALTEERFAKRFGSAFLMPASGVRARFD